MIALKISGFIPFPVFFSACFCSVFFTPFCLESLQESYGNIVGYVITQNVLIVELMMHTK